MANWTQAEERQRAKLADQPRSRFASLDGRDRSIGDGAGGRDPAGEQRPRPAYAAAPEGAAASRYLACSMPSSASALSPSRTSGRCGPAPSSSPCSTSASSSAGDGPRRPVGPRARSGAAAAGAARPGRDVHQRRAGARSRQERQDDEVAGRRAAGPTPIPHRRNRSSSRCSRSRKSQQPSEPTEKQAKEEPKEEARKKPNEKREEDRSRASPRSPISKPSSTRRPTTSTSRSRRTTTASRAVRNRSSRPCIPAAACRCAARGASGKSDEFSKSVIAALMKTRPGPFALWGRVLVSFQITQQGDLLYVRVLHSSGNKAIDDAAVSAIHKAQFIKPPPGLAPRRAPTSSTTSSADGAPAGTSACRMRHNRNPTNQPLSTCGNPVDGGWKCACLFWRAAALLLLCGRGARRRISRQLARHTRAHRLAIPVHALRLAAMGQRRCGRQRAQFRGQREPRAGARIPSTSPG